MDDETFKTYLRSDATVELSKTFLSRVSNPPQNFNANAFLKFGSPCFKNFFAEFCVSNANYSCAGRDLK